MHPKLRAADQTRRTHSCNVGLEGQTKVAFCCEGPITSSTIVSSFLNVAFHFYLLCFSKVDAPGGFPVKWREALFFYGNIHGGCDGGWCDFAHSDLSETGIIWGLSRASENTRPKTQGPNGIHVRNERVRSNLSIVEAKYPAFATT